MNFSVSELCSRAIGSSDVVVAIIGADDKSSNMVLQDELLCVGRIGI